MHAFGPATPALLDVLGADYRESCPEDTPGRDDIAVFRCVHDDAAGATRVAFVMNPPRPTCTRASV